MGIAVALICALATMIIFRALRMEEHSHIERMTSLATDTVRADITADMKSRMQSELRFAKMWEGDEDDLTRRSWNLNSSLFMSHHPGCIAVYWLDAKGRVAWATPRDQVVELKIGDIVTSRPWLPEAMVKVRELHDQTLMSPTFDMSNGRRGRWAIVPVRFDDDVVAYVLSLYDLKTSMDSMLDDVSGLQYSIAVSENGQQIYTIAGTSDANRAEWAKSTSVQIPDVIFDVQVWPKPELLASLKTHLPEAALMVSVSLCVLVILAVRLATVARIKSRDLQLTNDQLKSEISERERVEAALRSSRARFAGILEISADAVVSTDDAGRITLFNQGAERMFGYKAEEVIGEPVELLIPERPKTAHHNVTEVFRGKADGASRTKRENEAIGRRKDGSEFHAEATVNKLELDGEKIVTAILRDVTHRRRAEDDLRRAHDELEIRVAERTHQLAESVAELQAEIIARKQAEGSLRELSARILQLQDSERRRIARELHDSTAQNLVAVSMNLASIRELLPPDNELLPTLLEDTGKLIDQAQSEIRTISYLLHPPLLDELGLASALQWYVNGFNKRSGIEVKLNVAEDVGRMPREYELTLFRIVQEALTNIHRHSRSRTAQIALERQDDGIRLEIRDQGCGVPQAKMEALATVGASLGVGIAGMRERVRQLGGVLEIASSTAGTMITTHMPVVLEENRSAILSAGV
jgi:PAS domain S-box-containing protein